MVAQVLQMQEARAELPQQKGKMHVAIEGYMQKLDHADFITRNNAQQAIIEYVNASLEKQNPLPTDVHQLFNPEEQKIGDERKERLRCLREQTEEAILRRPGRILSPKTLNLPLYKILEQQFHRSIIVSDPNLQERFESYDLGEDGQLSTLALYNLCQYLQCIPIFKTGYIELEPTHLPRALTVNDSIIRSTKIVHGIEQHTVTYAPDKGVILNTATIDRPCSSIESKMNAQKNLVWNTGNQNTPDPNMDITSEKECSLWVGINPQTTELLVEENNHVRLDPQTFSIHSIEEVNNEQQVTIHGTIFSSLSWPSTTCSEDTITYQLVAANTIQAFDNNGLEIPISVHDLSFSLRTFRLKISSKVPIQKLKIYGFTTIEQQTIQIPE